MKSIAIIGAGPAGVAAAIQLAKYNIRPLLFEQSKVGGLLQNARQITNYPGFVGGVEGIFLAKLLESHIESFGIEVLHQNVKAIAFDKNKFSIKADDTYETDILICASGTKPKVDNKIEIPKNCEQFIFYEVKDLLSVSNKKIAIIGAGDAAFDYALHLSETNDVAIFNRTDTLKCNYSLQEEFERTTDVMYFKNTFLKKLVNNQEGLDLTFEYQKSDFQHHCDYLIFAIGREPNLDFLNSDIRKNIDEFEKQRKLFLIGDVNNKLYRQTAICVGDGVKAAMQIFEELNILK